MSEADPNAAPASPEAGEYTVVARRYRPQVFEELIGQQHVAQALQQAIRTGRIGHAYLFTGARGVGKTSAARILAKALNCEQGPTPDPCGQCDPCRRVASGDDVDVLEIDGASNRGIDEIRQLRQNAGVRPSRSRLKVYIIDEVHMLTKEAFNALLKTLEEPPEHVKFIFATTEPQKIPITILSRCQRFDFAGVDASQIGDRLRQIAENEGVAIDDEALQVLSVRAAGSMRDSQSLLEQLLAIADGQITAQAVNTLLGVAPAAQVAQLAERLADRDAATGLALMDSAVRGGADPGQVLDQLMGYYRDVLAVTVGCPPEQMLTALPGQHGEALGLGKRLGVQTLLAAMQVLDQTASRMRVSVHERTLADMAVVRLASLEDLDDLAQAVADLRANPGVGVGQSAAGGSPVKKNAPAEPRERPAVAAGPPASMAPSSPPAPGGAGAPVREAPENAVGRIEPRPQGTGAPDSRTPPAAASPAPPVEEAGSLAESLRQQTVSVAPPAANAGRSPEPPAAPAPVPTPHIEPPPASASMNDANSLMAEFAAIKEGGGPSGPAAPPPPRRVSRRELQAQAAQHPFIAKAMEVFGVEPDKLKYTPPREP